MILYMTPAYNSLPSISRSSHDILSSSYGLAFKEGFEDSITIATKSISAETSIPHEKRDLLLVNPRFHSFFDVVQTHRLISDSWPFREKSIQKERMCGARTTSLTVASRLSR